MNARTVIISALVATTAVASSASAASWLRIGDKGTYSASASASITVSGSRVRGAKWLQISTAGVASVTHNAIDANGRQYVSFVETDAVPDINGSYSLSCDGDTYGLRSGSFSDQGRMVKIPVRNPVKCSLYMSFSASVDTSYLEDTNWVLARVTASSTK
jgi:hypothetical protein